MVRVQISAKVGIARGEHRPNLWPETRSEARHNRPSQSTFQEVKFSERRPSPPHGHVLPPSHTKHRENEQRSKTNAPQRQLRPVILTSGVALDRWCSSTSSSVLSSSSLE